jgi:hypothetical protein
MSGLPQQFGLTSSTAAEGFRLAATRSAHNARPHEQKAAGSGVVLKFPKRPDLTVLSETIPLFYIARNNCGFWVAREADGGCGGVFVSRRAAIRFARHKSATAGCAMMFLTESLELDVENEGSRLVEPLTAIMDFAARRTPAFATFVALAVEGWRKLVAQISHALAAERRNRTTIERELFHDRYTLSSKNDDDLPVA